MKLGLRILAGIVGSPFLVIWFGVTGLIFLCVLAITGKCYWGIFRGNP